MRVAEKRYAREEACPHAAGSTNRPQPRAAGGLAISGRRQDDRTVWRVVRVVGLVLAFGGYAWWTVDQVGKGGWAMWVGLAAWPLVATYMWAARRPEKRVAAQRDQLEQLWHLVEPLVRYPPLADFDHAQRMEFLDALAKMGTFERLPAKWQSAILEAERNRPPDERVFTGKDGAPNASVGGQLADRTGPSGFDPPPQPDPPPPDLAPVLPQSAPVEPFFGEVSEEARRFWSRPHPRLLYTIPTAVGLLIGATGVVGAFFLAEELGAVGLLAPLWGGLALAVVVSLWVSRRYEIPLKLPPRPPPDPRNAPDRARFRPRVPPLLSLLVLPTVYAGVIPVLVFDQPDPTIKAENAPIWLASAGIVLALVLAAAVRMFRLRIDIDAGGLGVINFWKTRVIPWESVRAIRMAVPRWAGPLFLALDTGTAVAGTQGPGDDLPSGLRIFFSDSELAVPDSISVTATLWCNPQQYRRYQEALATLVKQAYAHGHTARESGTPSAETG
jgi:hypothetical protein